MSTDRQSDLPSDLKSFAAELAALAPSSGILNRDELMYRAGWEAGTAASPPFHSKLRAAAWLWPLTTAALVLIAAALSIVLAIREPEVQIVYVEKQPASRFAAEKQDETATRHIPAASQTSLSPSGAVARSARRVNDYLSLREQVLAFGVDALPASSHEPARDVTPLRDSRYGALIGELRGG